MSKKKSPQKKEGASAAGRWLSKARFEEIIDLAALPHQLLDDLIESGWDVPASSDREFSIGFLNRVKSHVSGRFLHGRPGR